MRSVEEQLEPLCSDQGLQELSSKVKATLTSDLQQVLRDIDSCRDCLDEGINRLQKKSVLPKIGMLGSAIGNVDI